MTPSSEPAVAPDRCCPDVFREREQIDPVIRGQVQNVLHGDGSWPLVLLGPAGRGKTCLALCIADWVQDHRGGESRYYTAGELGRMLGGVRRGEAAYTSGVRMYEDGFWLDMMHRGLFVLDELGLRGRPTDTEYEAVKGFLDRREKRRSVIVSNAMMNELRIDYDDRIVSRLSLGTILVLSGPDRRPLTRQTTLQEAPIP